MNATVPAPIDVCFLALGPPSQIDASTSIIRNIEAQSARHAVRYHLLVERAPEQLRAAMRSRRVWRGVPKKRVHLHTTSGVPVAAAALYRQLSRTATGPGPIYLYKPLLHLVLPRWILRLIVLDTDLFFFSDIAGLWAEFSAFGPRALLGLAAEQCPSYQEVERNRLTTSKACPPLTTHNRLLRARRCGPAAVSVSTEACNCFISSGCAPRRNMPRCWRATLRGRCVTQ